MPKADLCYHLVQSTGRRSVEDALDDLPIPGARSDLIRESGAATAGTTVTRHTRMAATAVLQSVRCAIPITGAGCTLGTTDVAGIGGPAIISRRASAATVATLVAERVTEPVRAQSIASRTLLGARRAG